MTWSEQQVLAASDSWRWVPPEATTFEVEGVQVIDYPEWAFTGCYVTPLDTGLASDGVAGLIHEVGRTAMERGKTVGS